MRPVTFDLQAVVEGSLVDIAALLKAVTNGTSLCDSLAARQVNETEL